MSLSASGLIVSLGVHLANDAGIEAQIGDGNTWHAHVDDSAQTPFVLYRLSNVSHRDAQGLGEHVALGQTPTVTAIVSAVDEASDPTALAPIADALDDAMRAWAPTGWSVLQFDLVEERSASHDAEGRTYQAVTMTYNIIMERTA